jgi:prophage regulatory protein
LKDTPISNPEPIIRLKTVIDRTGLSRTPLYRKMADGTFPDNVEISVHGVGWHESAVNRWIANATAHRSDNNSTGS